MPADNDAYQESSRLKAALRLVGRDMHNTSNRPCATCRKVSEVLGEPFGCYAYQAGLKTVRES